MATRATAGGPSAEGGRGAAATGALAARLLSGPAGARIAMIETGGWDSHAQQRGRLAPQLRGLDAMLGSLESGLGAAWERTVVLVATEFGRTVAVNGTGTGGTDHGTGTLAMLLGDAVHGGRVFADWPGLAPAALSCPSIAGGAPGVTAGCHGYPVQCLTRGGASQRRLG
jgi:uncharacterized protein (DUF1501 family)